jgi:addiction module HigA family antidote
VNPKSGSTLPKGAGPYLKALIRARTPKIRQSDLADALQVTRLTVNTMLNGKTSMTPEMAVRVEAVLGVPASMLMEMQAECDLISARGRLEATLSRMKRLADMGDETRPTAQRPQAAGHLTAQT